MESVIVALLSNPVFAGYLDLVFVCCFVYFFVKINSLDEKLMLFENEQKDDIKDIKDKITKIENNISLINQNLIELAKGS